MMLEMVLILVSMDMDMDMEDLRAGRGIAPCPTRVENHPSPASNFWVFSPVHNVQGARQYYVVACFMGKTEGWTRLWVKIKVK